MLAPPDAKRLRRLRQGRYYRAKRDGLVTIRARVDPTSTAEFLHDCGVRVLYQDRETLAAGVEELLRRFELRLLLA